MKPKSRQARAKAKVKRPTDAVRASRDGHEFHEAWAARKAMQLLLPDAELIGIAVEGPQPSDQVRASRATVEIADLVLYYGGRPVTALRSPESIRAFLDAGGRTFVVKQRKLERVTAHVPVREVSRSRAGRRAVLVVVAGDGDARGGDGDARAGAVR